MAKSFDSGVYLFTITALEHYEIRKGRAGNFLGEVKKINDNLWLILRPCKVPVQADSLKMASAKVKTLF